MRTPSIVTSVVLTAWLTRNPPARMPDSLYFRAAALTATRGRLGYTNVTSFFSGYEPIEILRAAGVTRFVEFPWGYPGLLALLSRPWGFEWGWRLTHLLAAAAIGWSASVVMDGAHKHPRAAACVLAGVTVLSPAITTAMLRVQTEFVLCAVSALVIAGSVRHVRDERSITVAAVAAAAAPLVRFVGVGLVLVPVFVARRMRPGTRVLLLGAMLVPTALNQLWITADQPSRVRSVHALDWDYLTNLARTIDGWLRRSASGDPRALGAPGTTGWVALIVVVIVVGVLLATSRSPHTRADAAWVPLLAAGCLTASILVGMVAADRFVRPDTRQLLAVQLCMLWAVAMAAVAWWPFLDRARRVAIASVGSVWLVVAIAPWSTVSTEIDPVVVPDAAALEAAATATGAEVIFTDNAEPLSLVVDTPTAYLPFDVDIITGEELDAARATRELVCNLGPYSGAVMLLKHHGWIHMWGSVIEVLEEGTRQGLLEREETPAVITYLPTDTPCRAVRFPS